MSTPGGSAVVHVSGEVCGDVCGPVLLSDLLSGLRSGLRGSRNQFYMRSRFIWF